MSHSDLNTGQRTAVDSTARRVVVSAGAGSGKTRVLAVRFADAVLAAEREGAAAPMRSVLLITFTEKAAGELAERVRRVLLERGRADLAREVDSAWISTIHGFCARIVRRHAMELGVDPGFGVLADPGAGLARREAFERAATAMLADPGLVRLIAAHGPDGLRTSTLGAHDRVRSMGREVADVACCEAPDLSGSLRELPAALHEAVNAYGALAANATIEENTAKYVAALGLVEGLERPVPDESVALQAAGLHALYKGAMRGREETTRITAAANAALLDVAQAGVDTLAAAEAATWLALLQAYGQEYEAAKAAQSVLDFEDLQLLTRRLWRERPAAAERYARQFSQVLMDEFQDTNELQFEAIEPVAGRGLCLVGDVQQSIYRFRDADVGLFIDQKRSAEVDEAAEACRLTVNYRSHPELLATFNALFEDGGFFGSEYLHLDDAGARPSGVTWPEGEPRAEMIVVDKAGWPDKDWRAAEARALARRVRQLVDEGRATPDDIVVLARAMTTARPFVDALRGAGFRVVAAEAGGFYATPEVADVRALLRVLANPLDTEGVVGLLAGGLGGLSDDALFRLTASRTEGDLWAALPVAAEAGLGVREAERARLVHQTVGLLRDRQGRMRLADAILYAESALGPGGGCLARAGASGNLHKVVRLAAEFEQVTPADPAAFLRYLADRETYVRKESSVGIAVQGSGAIRVMSVHGAKGLEFPVVVLADLGHGVVNSRDAFALVRAGGSLTAAADVTKEAPKGAPKASAWAHGDEEERRLDLEESKRVLYVACTRAEQALLLTGSTRLDRPPDDKSDIDRLRSVVAGAGQQGVPGLRVTIVSAVGAEGPLEPATSPTPRGPAPESGPAAPLTVLRPPGAIAAPAETSYTALALYQRCGYRFFAERVLGVGSVDITEGDDPRAFGSALHGALQNLAEGRPVDDARLSSLASAHRLPVGGVARLREAVEAFRASRAGELLGPGRAEVAFAVPVAGGVVAGSMDLVARDGEAATVIDYKTGAAAGDGSRYRTQAEVYALAMLVAGCERVTVRFVWVEVGCEETALEFTAADRPAIEGRIEEAFAAMRRGEFARLRSFDASVCPDCPVSGGLCPIVHRGGKQAGRR